MNCASWSWLGRTEPGPDEVAWGGRPDGRPRFGSEDQAVESPDQYLEGRVGRPRSIWRSARRSIPKAWDRLVVSTGSDGGPADGGPRLQGWMCRRSRLAEGPTHLRVGYHVDWATGFPFEAIGLPDNGGRPLRPSGLSASTTACDSCAPLGDRWGAGLQWGGGSSGPGNAAAASRLLEVAAARVSQASASARRRGVNRTATDEACE